MAILSRKNDGNDPEDVAVGTRNLNTAQGMTPAPVPVAPGAAHANQLDTKSDIEKAEDTAAGDGTGLTQTTTTATQDVQYPSSVKLALITVSMFTSMFLVALDRLIIATAIPAISDEFHSADDIGWYGSAYLLTSCAFQLLFGKVYTFYSIKLTFLSSIFLFEVGSAVCGAAPSSVAFIVGRAIAGVGSAGLYAGIIVVITYAVPLNRRPMYQGLFGAIFGLASVIGPLLGGAFTTNVTWRWCFYINLPFGGVAMVLIFFLLEIPDRNTTKLPTRQKLAQLDAAGTSVFMPGVICLLLALQWGGLTYAWANGRIIALLVLAGVLLLAFVAAQAFLPKTATIPPRICLQRSVAAGTWCAFTNGSQMMIFVYFLPIWFQAIQGVSAVESGIRTLPLVLALVGGSISTGALTSRIGYYTPFLIWGICLMSVGAGILTTLQIDTSQAKWAGSQFLYGWGLGSCMQAPNLAAQTVLPRRDVPIGTSLIIFTQLLGGAIFVSVGQNVLDNQLVKRLAHLPGFTAESIVRSGATGLTNLSPELQEVIIPAYNESLRVVFHVGLALSCVAILGAAAMEWKSVKTTVQKETDEQETEVPAPSTEDGERAVSAGTNGDASTRPGSGMEKQEEVRN